MSSTLAFQNTYWEQVTVAGNARLRLRVLRPTDKPKLTAGFQRLSMASRYQRFFHHKQALTPADLIYFTEFDGIHHLAIGAFESSTADGEEALVGVARFIGFLAAATRAEFSLVVNDDYQGRRLGRLLLDRLRRAAAERGITQLRGYLLAENRRGQRLLQGMWPDTIFRRDEGMVIAECPVPHAASATGSPRVLAWTVRWQLG